MKKGENLVPAKLSLSLSPFFPPNPFHVSTTHVLLHVCQQESLEGVVRQGDERQWRTAAMGWWHKEVRKRSEEETSILLPAQVEVCLPAQPVGEKPLTERI